MSKQREDFEAWLKESNKHVYDVYMDSYSSSDNAENMCAEWAWSAWQEQQKIIDKLIKEKQDHIIMVSKFLSGDAK